MAVAAVNVMVSAGRANIFSQLFISLSITHGGVDYRMGQSMSLSLMRLGFCASFILFNTGKVGCTCYIVEHDICMNIARLLHVHIFKHLVIVQICYMCLFITSYHYSSACSYFHLVIYLLLFL
jgi:hypothetical protein